MAAKDLRDPRRRGGEGDLDEHFGGAVARLGERRAGAGDDAVVAGGGGGWRSGGFAAMRGGGAAGVRIFVGRSRVIVGCGVGRRRA